MTKRIAMALVCVGLLWGAPLRSSAAEPSSKTQKDVDQLERKVQQQDEVIQKLETRIDQLESPKETTPPVAAPAAPPRDPNAAPAPAEEAEAKMYPESRQSPVENRGNLDDQQEAAARPGDFVLDPKYRGFIPIPQTVFMTKFNPKPRVDLMMNTRNPDGEPYRFVPARFPIKGTTEYDTGSEFDATANGSQIRVDMRAPSLPGNFRLYYQNDFFGDDTRHMRYRLQHFYGQYYGVVGGFTYGVFEDPDTWPDTVDYEGPNSMIFARRPVIHYTMALDDNFNFTVGLEDPNTQIDTTGDPTASKRQRAPDGGFNFRWEPGSLGHLAVQHDLPLALRAQRRLRKAGRLRLGRQSRRLDRIHQVGHDAVPRRGRRGNRRPGQRLRLRQHGRRIHRGRRAQSTSVSERNARADAPVDAALAIDGNVRLRPSR